MSPDENGRLGLRCFSEGNTVLGSKMGTPSNRLHKYQNSAQTVDCPAVHPECCGIARAIRGDRPVIGVGIVSER